MLPAERVSAQLEIGVEGIDRERQAVRIELELLGEVRQARRAAAAAREHDVGKERIGGPRGRLRLVRSEHDLNDVIAEVPPEQGTLLLFKNEPNAWHGFEPFSGPRRVIQLNWVTSASVVRREQFRHRVSALFKRLKGRK